MSKTVSFALLALLASIIAITPLAIDMYLPAMPVMADELNTDSGLIQQSLSIYLAAYGVGMLLFGPMADAIGRRPLALGGLCVFCLASLALGFCHDAQWLLVLRALQAFAGSAATVVIPGIIRALYQENTAKGMSYVSMIMMMAPLIAPAIGSAVLWVGHWQDIFLVLALYSALIAVLTWRFLPDPVPVVKGRRLEFLSGYRVVFGHVAARPQIATSMFASFSFFCFLTAVPFVYIEYYGVNEQLFSLLFALNVGMLMLANFCNSRLVGRFGPQRMLNLGLVSALCSAMLLCLANWLELGLVLTVLSIAPLMASLGLIATNADAMILMRFPEHSGTATAVIGTLRFGSGALAGPLLAVLYSGTALPFSLLMLSGVLAIAISQLLGLYQARFARKS
ncbi:Bcr/CflA family efflux MFS transporter [Rheinheimera mesophila]|uniref:Bcr/CflA family efflux transporter n=1 Tax=Rheinheimera mesophila TaxID=1547515 RepID=A0A3P3QK49_9GAMM|nr:Bcr/CflA family efflux MFS transporter [Rheinheimera mesophila]KKK99956.1 major facilitator transporter [Rheinheimera mesophila]RRJ21415.1 Bcr/CflA family efflux MFS transporter [Rheinheimera mesophila]